MLVSSVDTRVSDLRQIKSIAHWVFSSHGLPSTSCRTRMNATWYNSPPYDSVALSWQREFWGFVVYPPLLFFGATLFGAFPVNRLPTAPLPAGTTTLVPHRHRAHFCMPPRPPHPPYPPPCHHHNILSSQARSSSRRGHGGQIPP